MGGGEQHVDSGPLTPQRIRRNWHWMSAIFGLNCGCATAPLVFATTLLDRDVGYAGSALLYVFTCLSSLFVSVPTVVTLGQRLGMVTGMGLYSIYVCAFTLSAAAPDGSWVQWALFLPGSCLGGVAASFLWTAQGGYLDRSTTALLEAEAVSAVGEAPAAVGMVAAAGADDSDAEAMASRRKRITAEQASTFAVYFLLFEVMCKLASALALQHNVPPHAIFSICLVVSISSALAQLRIIDFNSGPAAGREMDATQAGGGARAAGCASKLLKAISLWSDPSLWLLSFTNMTFGFCAAFMNGYVNAAFTKPQLGKEWVGYFATVTVLIAALASHIFGSIAQRLGRKGPFVLFGSICFLAIPALVILVGFDGWGYFLILPYILQGCGRAVYESIGRAIFADFFPGPQSEGAFANLMMQATMSFAFCFFFSAVLSREALATIVITLACLSFPGYSLARQLRSSA